MTATLRLLVCLAVAGVASASAQTSQAPELVSPAEATVTAKLSSAKNFDLRKQLYFAKRYRIVKIDFNLLDQPGQEFSIAPFEDSSIKVRAREIASQASYDGARHWRGEIVEPAPSAFAAISEADVDQEALVDSLKSIDLWIRVESREVSPRLQEELALSSDAPPRISSNPPSSRAAQNQSSVTKMTVQTVNGRWTVPNSGAQIVLMPIDEDPRYHLIYVEDPLKQPTGPDWKARRARFAEFSNQIEAERKKEQVTDP